MNTENLNHLMRIYQRLVNHHGENPNFDYMIKFKKIIDLEGRTPLVVYGRNQGQTEHMIQMLKEKDFESIVFVNPGPDAFDGAAIKPFDNELIHMVKKPELTRISKGTNLTPKKKKRK